MKYNQLKIENFQARIWIKSHQIQTPIVLIFFVPNSTLETVRTRPIEKKIAWPSSLGRTGRESNHHLEHLKFSSDLTSHQTEPSVAFLLGSSSSIQDCLAATCLPQSQRWFASEGDCADHFFIRDMEFSGARGSTLLYRWGRIARHGSSLSTCKGLSLAGGFLENCVSPLDDDADDGAVWRWRSWRSNFSSSRSMECCRSTILRKTRSPVAFWRSVNIWFGVKYDGRDSNRGLQMLSDNQHPAPEPFFIYDPKLIWVFLHLD